MSIAVWRVPARQVLAAAIESVLIAASILWIVFGVILLLKIQTASGAIAAIRGGFIRITPDPRAQAILTARAGRLIWLRHVYGLTLADGHDTRGLQPASGTRPLSCLVAEHCWDRVRWALEEHAWRFERRDAAAASGRR